MDICLREEVALTVYVIDALDLTKVGIIQTSRDVCLSTDHTLLILKAHLASVLYNYTHHSTL